MKIKTSTSLIAVGLLLWLTLPARVFALDFAYITNNGSITITGYTNAGNAGCQVIIPATIDGLPVTTIGDKAFSSCWQMNSVALPDSVTTIKMQAFHYTGLTNVMLGSNVTSLGFDVFGANYSLLAINVQPDNPAFSSVSGVLFDKDQTVLLQYPAGLRGFYQIPGTVTSIAGNAFLSTRALQATHVTREPM